MKQTVEKLVRRPVPWLVEHKGADGDVAVSTRIRLARNIAGCPFPAQASLERRRELLTAVQDMAPAVFGAEPAFAAEMTEFGETDQLVLLERRLVSRELCGTGAGSGVTVSRDEASSIMVNEEDHLRIQSMLPGFQLEAAWRRADELDTALAARLKFAFRQDFGYLSACPTNLGTGMRASVMLHLPALSLLGHMRAVVRAAEKLGLAVRGVYGEGSEGTGCLFQVSNQSTLGESEPEILARLERMIRQVIWYEHNARRRLLCRQRRQLYDHVGRAYGLLTRSYLVTSTEALNWLSAMRLGILDGLFTSLALGVIHQLMLHTQPGHLQKLAGRDLQERERDAVRADLLRKRLCGSERVGN